MPGPQRSPQPDGGFDPNKVYTDAAGAASNTTAKADIWSLPADLKGKTLVTDYGSKRYSIDQGQRSHLDAGDQQYQTDNSRTPPQEYKLDLDPTTGLPSGPFALPINMYSTNPKQYLELQRALFAAGYFGSKSASGVRWGSDTTATMDAWSALLRDTVQQQSLGHNVTWQEVLQHSAQNAKAASDAAGTPPQTKVFQYSDPAQVAGAAQRAAQAALGRNLSDSEIKHFISEFHAAEQSYGTQQNAAQAANSLGKGGTFNLTPPDLSAEAEQFVEQGHGTEAAGNDMSDYVRALEQMIGGG